jgi:hypothetical protein
MINFQAESKKSGDSFEKVVLQDLRIRGFTDIQQNVYMPGTGCEVDFIADNKEHIESKGGESGISKRPGAQRTDNVKKAIANGALIKLKYPDIYYVVYFSAKANNFSSSKEMIDLALANKIIDEVRYLPNQSEDWLLFDEF